MNSTTFGDIVANATTSKTLSEIIPDSWSHYFIIAMAVTAIFWAVAHAVMVSHSNLFILSFNFSLLSRLGRESRNDP
jgi:hypothetical protein